MLENYADLLACETILSEAVKSARLLGEIPLSDTDIEILASLVRQNISPNISRGTAYLKTKAPTCFVCFLVGMGRFYDKQAGYWPIVENKVGQIDLNWKVRWGKIFLQYLEQNDLPRFDEEEGLAYVTPILGHTCLPDCCLDEYFDRVLVPLVNRDLLNPLDQQEILHDLRVRRIINESRLELEKETKHHDERIKVLQQEKRGLKKQIEVYEEVASLLAEEEECKRRKIALHGLENAELTRLNLLSRINEATGRIQRLESKGKRLWGEITVFRRRYQHTLEVKPQIDDVIRNHVRLNEELSEALENEKQLPAVVINGWAKLSKEPWNDSFGVEIQQLPLEQLIGQILQYQNLQEQQKLAQEEIENLQALQKEVKRPSTLILSLLMLIKKTLIWIGRKAPVTQPSEIQQLQATYRETEAELHLQRDRIKGLFARLPVEEQLLENPTPDLHEEISCLQQTSIRFAEAHEKRIKLQEEEDQLRGQVRELVSSLDIAVDGNLNTWVNNLCEILKEAQQSRAAALEAERILEEEIRPVLEAARLEYQCLRADLEKLDQQLAELGGGSIHQGLSMVQEFHRFQATVAQARQNLSSRYSDLMVIERGLHSQGWDTIRRGLEEAVSEVENRIQATKSESKQIKRGFDSHPVQYFGVDEPIRRFLLYGGITADKYLTDSVLLFAQAKSGERVEDISDLHLPNRIIQRFQQWWEYYRTRVKLKSALEEETNLVTGERFRAPQISFDVATGEVIAKLPTQRLLRPDQGTTVRLDVFCADLSNLIYTGSLKLYNRSRGLVETHSCEDIMLTTPSKKYIFRLKSKDNPIREWEIQGISAGTPFLAFSSSTHKFIRGENLPRSPLILVINEKLRIHPQECILTESSPLFGNWKEYVWCEVDLTTVKEFCLSDYADQSLTIPLTSEFGSGIALIGGNQLAGVLSDERPVFNFPPEFIRIPMDTHDDLRLLRFSLFTEDENRSPKSKHYQVDELLNLINKHDEGWLDIPLNDEQLLGPNPVGCFTLRIYQPPYLDWPLSFCIVPQLNTSFNQEIYLPYREKIPDVIATLTLPERSTFKPDTPAKLVSSDGTSWIVQTPASENEITGMLLYSTVDGERINIPLTFFVPKLRWRLRGLDDPHYDQWFDRVQEELWIGDWMDAQELFLVVETPWFYKGEVSLVLPGNSVIVNNRKIHDQKIRFDLKALEDTLRAGPSPETFSLSLKDTRIKHADIPVFTIRTRWQVNIERCFHYPEYEPVQLSIFWKEKGKVDQKIIRLWRLLNDQPHLVKEQVLSQNEYDATLSFKMHELQPGYYRIHLEPYDPWLSKRDCPPREALNTIDYEISSTKNKEVVLLRSIWTDEKHEYCLRKNSYRIRIIGVVSDWKLPVNIDVQEFNDVLVVPYNEGWYVGSLEVTGVPEVIDKLTDTNPVKLESGSQKSILITIEDRHGEGAMYCFECNMLFWAQETNLKHRHKIYGPIRQFRADWSSE